MSNMRVWGVMAAVMMTGARVSAFQLHLPTTRRTTGVELPTRASNIAVFAAPKQNSKETILEDDKNAATAMLVLGASAVLFASDPAFASDTTTIATTTTTTTLAAAGPVGSAVFAWLHFLGIMGVAGGLVTERLVIKKDMSVDEENIINGADLIYGLSALSLLISGYFRATSFAKGWDFYKNEPIFWIKMSAVAVLGALSFFPAIVFFRRDMLRKEGNTLPPLSDALVDRCTTIINAELLALLTIPFMASLMARGVLYVDNFPWTVGAGLYVISLGGAGFKYITEALEMMEAEGALVPIESSKESD